METRQRSYELYYVYADADEPRLLALEAHLRLLEDQKVLRGWHRRRVLPGEDWQQAVDRRFESADIILLLVSPDLLDSKYCYDTEMERAMLRHLKGEVLLVPVVLRPCMWELAPFAGCPPLPNNAVPVSLWDDADSAFLDVAKGIHRLLQSSPDERRRSPTAEHLAVAAKRFAVREWVDRLEGLLATLPRVSGDPAKSAAVRAEIGALDKFIRPILSLKEGDVVGGMELLHPIGHGAFATVWLSRNEGLDDGQRFATKVLHSTCLTTGSMLCRFRRGVKAMKYLTRKKDAHAQIVKLLHEDDSSLAFTMPFLPGQNLVNVKERGWSTERKVEVLISICRAVEYAHRRGVVHRDIKPANIVFDAAGEPVLTDFDIADMDYETTVSIDERGLGSPMFASPEQLEDGAKSDPRCDVYSLGRLLHYVLVEGPMRVTPEHPDDLGALSRFPVSLVSIVLRATRRQASKRYPDVASLRAALEQHHSAWSQVSAGLGAFGPGLARWIMGVIVLLLTAMAAVTFNEYHEYREQQVRTLTENYDRLQGDYEELLKERATLSDRRDELQEQMKAIVARYLESPDDAAMTTRLLRDWLPLKAEHEAILEKEADIAKKVTEKLKDIDAAHKQLETARKGKPHPIPPPRQTAVAAAVTPRPSPSSPGASVASTSEPSLAKPAPLTFTDFTVALANAESRAAARCRAPRGTNRNVQVEVRLNPSGIVTAQMLAGPRGTEAEMCVLAEFWALRVRPFEGSALPVPRTLVLQAEK